MFGALLLLGAICLCVKLNTLGMVAGVCGVAVLFLILEKDISCFRNTRTLAGAAAAVLARMLGISWSSYKRLPALSIASGGGLCCMEDEGVRCGLVP